jgi:hypothetical protein
MKTCFVNQALNIGSITKKLLIIVLFIFSAGIYSQNLIPNPGFETYSQLPCACMHGDVNTFVKSWENVGSGTADILSSNADQSCYASTNSNHWDSFGFEAPNGGNTMGMIMTEGFDGTYREYLGLPLSTPLRRGREYYLEFYVSLGDYCGVATNNIGALFTVDKPRTGEGYIVMGTPQVNYESVILENNGWVKISGSFIADDNYRFMTVGNFAPTSATEMERLPEIAFAGGHTYRKGMAAYYIDDFLLLDKSADLTVTGDTLVHTGELATLTAKGGNTYKWADAKNPKTIIAYGPELNQYMKRRTKYIVYSDIDTASIIVRVHKQEVDNIGGRTVTKKKIIDVYSDEITIEVYDKNDVDGDTLSIYDGETLIAAHVGLEKAVKSFTIQVDRTQSTQIIVFAENEGTSPPNTACIILRDGKNTQEILLKSDMKSSDSVILNYAGEIKVAE